MVKSAPIAPVIEGETGNFFVSTNRIEVLRIAILGLILGLLIPLLTSLIDRYFIDLVFCRNSTSGICSADAAAAYYIATIILTIVAIVVMVNWGIFRPLLIAVAAAATLWGFQRYLFDLSQASIVEYYIYSAVLFSLMYLLFYWLLRINNFALSLVLTIIVVVGVRWALLA